LRQRQINRFSRRDFAMPKPKKPTAAALERVGVEIVNVDRFHLRCARCRQVWSPQILFGGRLHPRYWWCPNRCNWPDRK
jgi:hypothetical protein